MNQIRVNNNLVHGGDGAPQRACDTVVSARVDHSVWPLATTRVQTETGKATDDDGLPPKDGASMRPLTFQNQPDKLVSVDATKETRQQHRLELARKAFRDFYGRCFWSSRPDAEITTEDLPFIIRQLRHHGGHAGYRVVAELCR